MATLVGIKIFLFQALGCYENTIPSMDFNSNDCSYCLVEQSKKTNLFYITARCRFFYKIILFVSFVSFYIKNYYTRKNFVFLCMKILKQESNLNHLNFNPFSVSFFLSSLFLQELFLMFFLKRLFFYFFTFFCSNFASFFSFLIKINFF